MTTLRSRWSRSEGFGIIEASVAMMLSALLFTVLATVLMTTASASRDVRLQTEATQLGVEAIENIRALSWDDLAMTEVTEPDPRTKGASKFDGSTIGLDENEELVIDGDASVVPEYTVRIDTMEFVIESYITEADAGLRRAIVFVSWENAGDTRSHHTTALISEARTGS